MSEKYDVIDTFEYVGDFEYWLSRHPDTNQVFVREGSIDITTQLLLNYIYKGHIYESKTNTKERIRKDLLKQSIELPMLTNASLEDYRKYFIETLLNETERVSIGNFMIDKLTLRLNISNINEQSLSLFKKGPITIFIRGEWVFIHIHGELFHPRVNVGYTIYYVLNVLYKNGVFMSWLASKIKSCLLDTESIKELLKEFFYFSGYEIAWDFDKRIEDLINMNDWNYHKLYPYTFYSKDFGYSRSNKYLNAKRYKTFKSLLCIYARGRKLNLNMNVTRFEVRMEKKYITSNRFHSPYMKDWSFIQRIPSAIGVINRKYIALAVETALKRSERSSKEVLCRLYNLVKDDRDYDLLRWILCYACPELLN